MRHPFLRSGIALTVLAIAVTGCAPLSPASDPTTTEPEPQPEPESVGYQAVEDFCDHIDFTAVYEFHDERPYSATLLPRSSTVEEHGDSNCGITKFADDYINLEWRFDAYLYIGETPDAAPTSTGRIDMTGTAEAIAERNAGVVVEGDWEAASAFQVDLGEVERRGPRDDRMAGPMYMFTTTIVVRDRNAVVEVVHTHTVSNAVSLFEDALKPEYQSRSTPNDQPRYTLDDLLPLLTAAAEETLQAADTAT